MEAAVLYNVPHQTPWKVFIPLYFYLTGLSAGAFILSAISPVLGLKLFKPITLPAGIIAFVLVLLAPLCLILDLHQPTRFWYTLVPDNFNRTSALSYGSWLLTLYPLASLIYLYGIFVGNDRIARSVGIIAATLAILVGAYTGFAFARLTARAWWHSALMPGYFLTSAVLSGTALVTVVALVLERYRVSEFDPEIFRIFRVVMLSILLIDWFWHVSLWLILLSSSGDGYASLTVAFNEKLYVWGELVAGMLAPLIILVLPWTRSRKGWLCIASLLIIGGVFLMRYSLVFVAFDVPLS